MNDMKRKQFNWKEILGHKAWTAQEIADKLGMHILTCRRYLRFAERARVLVVKKYGRIKYYAVREYVEEALKSKKLDSFLTSETQTVESEQKRKEVESK